MSRPRYVTRTIKVNHVKIMAIDLEAKKPFETEITVGEIPNTEEKFLQRVKKIFDTDNIKAVHIISYYSEDVLYGMPEQKFIELSEVLPARATTVND